jgi:site-specific DNA recombinase
MRAAAYVRVSTARQAEKDLSIPDQLRQIEAYCKQQGWTLARSYVEPGASATDDKRPVFQEMIAAARRPERDFDCIVVYHTSRFFRASFEFEFYLRKLTKAGVRLFSVTQPLGDDPDSEFYRKILALIDERYSLDNARNTLRAMRENARQGFWNGSLPPYGYRAVEAERRGDKVKKRLELDPDEAPIVRLIFNLHLNGTRGQPLGVKAIADHLNRTGYRFRDGKRYSTGLVHRLLTRETYVGRHFFNQIEARTKKTKPRDEWIEMKVPAIIDDGTFTRVQSSLAERNPKRTPPRVVSSPILLTGLAVCGSCGGGMTLRTGRGNGGLYRYYTCSTCARLGKTACRGRSIPMHVLDEAVTEHLGTKLFTPERMRSVIPDLFARSATAADDWAAKAKEAERHLRDIERRRRRLFELVESEVVPAGPALKKRFVELEQEEEAHLRLKAEAERRRQYPRQVPDARKVDAFCVAAKARLKGGDTAFRKAFLRLFISRIEVHDGEVRIMGPKRALEAGLESEETPGEPVRSSVQAPTGFEPALPP